MIGPADPATSAPTASWSSRLLQPPRRLRAAQIVAELAIVVLVAYLYGGAVLLDFDPQHLQQTGEHNEAATLPILTEIGLVRHGTIPLWNPYMLTGFPYAGDLVSNFFNPIATVPVLLWGGVNGMKVSAWLAFLVAGLGQWALGYVLRLRSPMRLWSALLVMLSGGLGLFWWLGWYQLLVGMAWFPACYAASVWALRTRGRAPLALAALAIAMVLTSSGAYYIFYLAGSLLPVFLAALIFAPAGGRLAVVKRAAIIGVLSLALLAAVFLPVVDVYRFATREAAPDPVQGTSQPIPYALFNYVVADGRWFRSDVLGQGSGYTWFYIGYLPLAALVCVPLAFNGLRSRAFAVTLLIALTALILAWHANRYTLAGEVYRALPVLYFFRFPNRLLVLATVPLVALGAFGLQALWGLARRWSRRFALRLVAGRGPEPRVYHLSLVWVGPGLIALIMLQSLVDVYQVNQPFAFTLNQQRDVRARDALAWLKQYDPGLYYVSIGDWRIFWGWTAAAYEAEQPAINFQYNRFLNTWPAQRAAGSLVRAAPKYLFAWGGEAPPEGATLLNNFGGVPLYAMPDTLPFAFSVPPERLADNVPLTSAEVQAVQARWVNPNRLEVTATGAAGRQLVALVSTFPGWRATVDGQPVALAPVNDYLGTQMLDGAHTYAFVYEPPLHYAGLGISAAASIVAAVWLLQPAAGRAWAAARRRLQRRTAPAPAT